MGKYRNAAFLLFTLIVLAVFHDPLRQLVNVAFAYAHNSHLILIPGISAFLIFINRKRVFSNTHPSRFVGTLILLAGFLFYLVGKWSGLRPYPPENPLYYNNNDYLSLMIICLLTSLVGGFIVFYGVRAFHSASFAICFLIFMVPLPPSLLGSLTWILQIGAFITVYLDHDFLAGTVHLRAGIPLFLLALAFLTPIFLLLRNIESHLCGRGGKYPERVRFKKWLGQGL